MKLLMELPPSNGIAETMTEQLGIPIEQMDSNAMIVNAALMGKAFQGDPKAYQMISELTTGRVSEEIRIKREELKIKREQHEMAKAEWQLKNSPQQLPPYKGIPADQMAPWFLRAYHDILSRRGREFVFPGGRGSAESSGISLVILDLMMRHPDISALVMRNVGNTLNNSVFNQMKWALDVLGLEKDFKSTKNPMQMIRHETGQVIFFSGADDAGKIKGLKPEKGYVGIVWFEELDQYAGPETIRNLEQSALRGGDLTWAFKSYNPPKTVSNWANEYVLLPKPDMRVYRSTYLDVPPGWLGEDWIAEAESLRQINPNAYENEYLGVANGTGGLVFDNLELREITDDEIKRFDVFFNGVDWGWYPDPFAFVRVAYDRARLTLYVIDEYVVKKKKNAETAEEVKKHVNQGDLVTCDSAEPKSVGDFKAAGINAREAEKGPESRRYSYKWLQSLVRIVIDPARCPVAADEFLHKEYERDKDGMVIEGYPDGDDHTIDAVRYATNREWKRKGQ